MTVSMFDKRPAGNAGLFLSDLRGISFYLLIFNTSVKIYLAKS